MPGGPANESDDDEDAYLLWSGLGWIWRTGMQTADLSGLPAMAVGAAASTPADTNPGEAGHVGLNPFSRPDTEEPVTAPPPPADDLPWGWLLAGGVGLLGLFAVWWRGRGKAA